MPSSNLKIKIHVFEANNTFLWNDTRELFES